jgi:hypothetical protein
MASRKGNRQRQPAPNHIANDGTSLRGSAQPGREAARPNPPAPSASFDSALAETVNGYYQSELIYGACPIRAVEDQIGTRRAEGIGLATAMVKPC